MTIIQLYKGHPYEFANKDGNVLIRFYELPLDGLRLWEHIPLLSVGLSGSETHLHQLNDIVLRAVCLT